VLQRIQTMQVAYHSSIARHPPKGPDDPTTARPGWRGHGPAAGLRGAHASGVEALLTTVAALVVMAVALIVLARSWPHSSRRTGYRISGQDSPDGQPPPEDGQPGETPPVVEDDDVHWHWPDRRDG
jgi:hypothetical protein